MNQVKAAMKPIRRSRLRLFAGKRYFTWKRYLQWLTRPGKKAKVRMAAPLDYQAASHATPLLRSLRNVDMQLQYNKITNLRLAAGKLDGLLIRPGETFSYWRSIGKPTRRKGYLDGMVLYSGGFRAGTGGGLCQLSNLIYWITLHTPLTVTERHRHSYDVFPDERRTQPFGSGATCAYNYLDLQLKNNTEHTYQLKLHLDDTHLHGEWRCEAEQMYRYEVYEADHVISLEPWGGYIRSNIIRRKVLTRSGALAGDEAVAENHALMMYSPLLYPPAGTEGESTPS
ncbi:VanW family protein [Paenibacillus pedocola]|uniref:VanW family protein n=1 Tax=Paenibacillus pedocola TaxID=3242193 RepID=UPI002877FB90|nr:VanW family protein [Paenibacillus typhae]